MGFLTGGRGIFHDQTVDPLYGEMSQFQGGINNMFNTKGSKYYSRILKGLLGGDASLISNPFQYQTAARNREIERSTDPFLPPELQARRVQLDKARNEEFAGAQFEDYVSGMANQAAQSSMQQARDKVGAHQNMFGLRANTLLGSDKYFESQSPFLALTQGIKDLSQAGSNLGWKPFGGGSSQG